MCGVCRRMFKRCQHFDQTFTQTTQNKINDVIQKRKGKTKTPAAVVIDVRVPTSLKKNIFFSHHSCVTSTLIPQSLALTYHWTLWKCRYTRTGWCWWPFHGWTPRMVGGPVDTRTLTRYSRYGEVRRHYVETICTFLVYLYNTVFNRPPFKPAMLNWTRLFKYRK